MEIRNLKIESRQPSLSNLQSEISNLQLPIWNPGSGIRNRQPAISNLQSPISVSNLQSVIFNRQSAPPQSPDEPMDQCPDVPMNQSLQSSIFNFQAPGFMSANHNLPVLST
jgi:hypothetical protein